METQRDNNDFQKTHIIKFQQYGNALNDNEDWSGWWGKTGGIIFQLSYCPGKTIAHSYLQSIKSA